MTHVAQQQAQQPVAAYAANAEINSAAPIAILVTVFILEPRSEMPGGHLPPPRRSVKARLTYFHYSGIIDPWR